jgi:16S rRNA (guanine527-N7)-methyltransferase
MDLISTLDSGLAALAIEASIEQRHRLLDFVGLLQKWNRTYNLTAIRDPLEMVTHHLLDSLSVLPHLEKSALARRCAESGEATASADGFRLADIGSGAGLPGLVLGIMRPDWRIMSIDKVDKKAAFQRQVCIELDLRNVVVRGERVESLPVACVDAAISRAFAELGDFVRLAGSLVAPGGRLYAMKGVMPGDEIQRLPSDWRAESVIPLRVPGLDARRHLVVLGRE